MRHNLQFPTAQRDYYIREAGLTDEEIEIFKLRSRGYSIVQIAYKMNEITGQIYGTERIERRIRTIKNKIANII